MKRITLALVALFFVSFAFGQIKLYSGQVKPLIREATPAHPKSLAEFVTKLKANQMPFIGGITSQQWLEMAAQGFNQNAAQRLKIKNVTPANMVWILENAEVVATKDLGLKQGDYYSSGSLSNKLYWIVNPNVPDSVIVYTNEQGEWAVIAKWDCLNPACDLKKAPPPPPIIVSEPVKQTVTVYDTVHVPLVVKPMTVRLQLCTASYIQEMGKCSGSHQQTFFHGVQEFTLATLPYDGEYINGKKFVTQVPKSIPYCNGIKITDYFWTTAN